MHRDVVLWKILFSEIYSRTRIFLSTEAYSECFFKPSGFCGKQASTQSLLEDENSSKYRGLAEVEYAEIEYFC